MNVVEVARNILKWHDVNARDLPWREERDPYRIWISEIMLQQTRAETVIPYYYTFLNSFPTVGALADADIEKVLKLWEGLGYYSRARNLHRAAKIIAYDLHGIFPSDLKQLKTLPGIGEYTAGAIASIAFGQRTPAIDGNQIRVLSRIFGIRDNVQLPATKKALRETAEALMPEERPGDFNQALMGIGAMICMPRNPKCDLCPVQAVCDARERGDQASLPLLPAPLKKQTKRMAVAMVFMGDKVYVRKRPLEGLLGGLWEFPCLEGALTAGKVRECLKEIGIFPNEVRKAQQAEHVFTHLIWRMTGWYCTTNMKSTPKNGKFVTWNELEDLPMGVAIKPYREAVYEYLHKGCDEG